MLARTFWICCSQKRSAEGCRPHGSCSHAGRTLRRRPPATAAAQQAVGPIAPGGDQLRSRCRLLAGGLRRRDLRLRRRPLLRLHRRHRHSTSRSSGWPPRRTARATGWSPPTAGSSPSATPASTARPAASHLNKPIVGMAADARRRGVLAGRLRRRDLRLRRRPSTARPAAIHLNKPIVGMAADARRRGYWLVASDGGIFAFGDAGFSARGRPPSTSRSSAWPPTPDGRGLLAGGLRRRDLRLRRRRFFGSTGAIRSTSRSSAWPPPSTEGATGSWPPTAGSSPTATPVLRLHGRPAPQQANRGHGGRALCRHECEVEQPGTGIVPDQDVVRRGRRERQVFTYPNGSWSAGDPK